MRILLPGLAACVLLVACPSTAGADDEDPWFARDKAFHFDVSAGVAAATYAVSAAWIVDARWKALALGGGLALGAGVGKEILDATGVTGGDPSWKDFTWDVIGTVAGLALAWGVDLWLGGVDREHPVLAAPASASTSAIVVRF
jgi:putative lipoprotein